MRYILLSDEKKYMGKDEEGKDFLFGTVELVQLIARSGKTFNTGTNVLYADKVIKACEDKEIKNFIALEDTLYNIVLEDLNTFNFKEFKLVGVAFCKDVENITNALKEKPEVKEIEFKIIGMPEMKVEADKK